MHNLLFVTLFDRIGMILFGSIFATNIFFLFPVPRFVLPINTELVTFFVQISITVHIDFQKYLRSPVDWQQVKVTHLYLHIWDINTNSVSV